MGQKVPPLEETKAIILKSKGAPWLADAQKKFTATYGASVKDPNLAMYLIAKHGGVEVEDIKASTDGGEGTQVLISEVIAKAKNPEAQGWTFVNGGKFENPESQDKYSLTGVILALEEGLTSTEKPKLDLVIADQTGIAKIVAYADATTLFTEAKVGRGSVVRIPLCNVQFGRHNFSKEKNQVWWKFAVPPFGQVLALDNDPREFFLNSDEDPLKENKAVYIHGFITHVGEREVEICDVCERWVMEKKPQDHDKCRESKNYGTHEQTLYEGTATSTAGQTTKLSFTTKPKVKIAVDLVDIFGRATRTGGLDVAFIRKGNTTVASEAPVAAPTPKKVAKPVPVVVETEEAEEEEPVEVPAPTPKKVVKKAAPPPPVEEETEEEAPEPEIVVKSASKIPAAVKAPVAKAKVAVSAPEEEDGVPADLIKFIEKACKSFGGSQRIFVLARNANEAGLLGEGLDEEAAKAKMSAYCAKLVEDSTVEWTNAQKIGVKWA